MPIDAMKYDPFDYYKDTLNPASKDNAKEFIDDLVKKANIDEEANKHLVKKIKHLTSEYENSEKRLSFLRSMRSLLIFLCVIGFLVGIVGVYLWVTQGQTTARILMTFIGFPIGIALLLLIVLYFNKHIKLVTRNKDKLYQQLKVAKEEAYRQLRPLFKLFNFKDFNKIVDKTTSIFKLDDELDPEKMLMLENLYHYDSVLSTSESVLDVMSGDIETNPFLRIRVMKCSMYKKRYVGTRTVTWTRTYFDSEGHMHTAIETDVLTAYVEEDAPRYTKNAYLIYGNEAAPDLKFIRYPSGLSKYHTKKDVDNLVKSRTKKLNKASKKAIEKGGNFQAMTNNEFESLFYAVNRNNEVQYRLLFTPLAQQNMVELITASVPFGDDFVFDKDHKINIISSTHGTYIFAYDKDAFVDYYDVAKIKVDFVKYINELFQSLYFDLAPILAIPLYQTTEGGTYNIRENLQRITNYEAESLVNHMKAELFKHPQTSTNQILKIKWNEKRKDGTELFTVTSYSYQEVKKVKLVPTVARNGGVYEVPVEYSIFNPLVQESQVAINQLKDKDDKEIKQNVDNGVYGRNKNYVAKYLESDHVMSAEECKEFLNYMKNNYNYF